MYELLELIDNAETIVFIVVGALFILAKYLGIFRD
jgi:DNA-binding MurR/RpiR family transcriptional regulator